MKKILGTGLLAIAVIAASGQPASAWVNARFGVGVNLGWQSGDNCFFWGAWHNGPTPPGPYDYHHGHHHGYEPPVYLPFIWVGHPHGHVSYPAPGPIDSFAMTPSQPVYPTHPAPTYYYYYPASYYYGR